MSGRRKRRHVREGVARPARPGQSVAERMPELALDWDTERNGEATPPLVAWSSNLRACWRCRRCQRPSESGVAARARIYQRRGPSAGCRSRMCSRRLSDVPAPGNSMRARYAPNLVLSFDLDANIPDTPDSVGHGSKREFYWRCLLDSGHPSYPRSLPSRRKRACPLCESLIGTHPDIADQWHPTRNGDLTPADVTPGYSSRVWWQCSRGHEWQAVVATRTNQGNACPDCVLSHRSAAEVKLWAELQAVLGPTLGVGTVLHHQRLQGVSSRLAKVDIVLVLNDRLVAVEYDGAYWHREREAPDRRKSDEIREVGHLLIRAREKPLNALHEHDVEFATTDPVEVATAVFSRLAALGWLPLAALLAAQDYIGQSRLRGSELAKELLADVAHADLGPSSLAETHPWLASEWDEEANGELTPRHVRGDWSRKVWWRCPLGDLFDESPGARISRGRHCPFCAGKRVNERNCLATQFPHLARELAGSDGVTAWQVYAGGHRTVEWCCSVESCGYRWFTEVKQRTQVGTGCPACAGKIATPSRNLRTERPEVAAIWHPTMNLDLQPEMVLPGCNKSVWWLCPGCLQPFDGIVDGRCRAIHQCCSDCAKGRSPRRRSHAPN